MGVGEVGRREAEEYEFNGRQCGNQIWIGRETLKSEERLPNDSDWTKHVYRKIEIKARSMERSRWDRARVLTTARRKQCGCLTDLLRSCSLKLLVCTGLVAKRAISSQPFKSPKCVNSVPWNVA